MTPTALISAELAKCEAATPGPWAKASDSAHAVELPNGKTVAWVYHNKDGGLAIPDFRPDAYDCLFIASARLGYPAALKALEMLADRMAACKWDTVEHGQCNVCQDDGRILAAFRAAVEGVEGEKSDA